MQRTARWEKSPNPCRARLPIKPAALPLSSSCFPPFQLWLHPGKSRKPADRPDDAMRPIAFREVLALFHCPLQPQAPRPLFRDTEAIPWKSLSLTMTLTMTVTPT